MAKQQTFNIGDRVVVKRKHRKNFPPDSSIARGEAVEITARRGHAYYLGGQHIVYAEDLEPKKGES